MTSSAITEQINANEIEAFRKSLRGELVCTSYGAANYDRLVELQTQFDPSNLFRFNQNIRLRI